MNPLIFTLADLAAISILTFALYQVCTFATAAIARPV